MTSTTVYGNVISNRLFTEKELPISVLALFGQEGLFDDEKTNWSELKQLTETIPDGQRRDKYDERILIGEKFDQSEDIGQSFRYKPSALARDTLLDMCKQDINNADRLKSVQAFRQQYISLVNKLPDVEWLAQSPEYKILLKDIDRKICTLEECADLRNDIEDMNCKPYIKSSKKT